MPQRAFGIASSAVLTQLCARADAPTASSSRSLPGAGRFGWAGIHNAGIGRRGASWFAGLAHTFQASGADRLALVFVSRSARRTGVASCPATSRSAPARTVPARSLPSSVDLLERVDRHLALGRCRHPLKFGALRLNLPQLFHIGRTHLTELLAPSVQSLLADLELAGGFHHRRPVRLPKYRAHLFAHKSALSHGHLASARGPFSQFSLARKSRQGQPGFASRSTDGCATGA